MFTSGYPYLVSDICKTVDEKLGAVWTEESIYMAVKSILSEKTTLFEDVIKNIENNEEIKTIANELLLSCLLETYIKWKRILLCRTTDKRESAS
ncbi:hypothetical protein [Anaerosporobacter sp.]|uniref:hypothetical protein n=1 Tax=Anaerosporobacter sp. TaxID=1872529 RepID=UPI00286F693B|nr:hypothetical protein [Anaerosporobacter sp.]